MTTMTQAAHDYEFTRAEFDQIRTLIHRHAGITLADGKRSLVYGRLSRRLRALNLDNFSDYIALLSPDSPEWQQFTNSLTTNLTAFFREQHHFPVLVRHVRDLSRRPIHIWSAAASTGEEAYSIAIALAGLFKRLDPPVRILATDLDTEVLATARAGIYPLQRLEPIDHELKRKFFRRGGGKHTGFGKVIPELQQMISFRKLNLLDTEWPMNQQFDAIFCRNVMIYFDKPTQHRLLEKFVAALRPDGLFFAGHSESFVHARELVMPLGRTVYRRANQYRSDSVEPHPLASPRTKIVASTQGQLSGSGER